MFIKYFKHHALNVLIQTAACMAECGGKDKDVSI